jgi:hypothetical protein
MPAADGVSIHIGRVHSVNEGVSFRVEPLRILVGQEWIYTPLRREYSIDPRTLFINDGGLTNINEFIGYTDASVVNDIYVIVANGGRAERVIDMPWPARAVRGTIYEVGDGTVSLRDMHVHYPQTGRWTPISLQNATGTVNIPTNSVVIDRNQVIGTNGLRVGQQVHVMVTNAELTAATIEH